MLPTIDLRVLEARLVIDGCVCNVCSDARALITELRKTRAVLQKAPVNPRYKDWYDEAIAILERVTDA